MLSKKLILIAIATIFSSLSLVAMQPGEECQKVEKKGFRLPFFLCTQKEDLGVGMGGRMGIAISHRLRVLETDPEETNTFKTTRAVSATEIGGATAFCEDNTCELARLETKPHLQNQGWGSWILQKTFGHLKQNNYTEVFLVADPVLKLNSYATYRETMERIRVDFRRAADPVLKLNSYATHRGCMEQSRSDFRRNENTPECKEFNKQYVQQFVIAGKSIREEYKAAENRLLRFYRKNGGQRPSDEHCKDAISCDKFFVFSLNQSKK